MGVGRPWGMGQRDCQGGPKRRRKGQPGLSACFPGLRHTETERRAKLLGRRRAERRRGMESHDAGTTNQINGPARGAAGHPSHKGASAPPRPARGMSENWLKTTCLSTQGG